jgi:hypothetical protein
VAKAVWRRISWRRGTKGQLAARFAALRARVADGPPQRIGDIGAQHMPGEEVWLVGEHRTSGERKYYPANLPPAAGLRRLAATIKARWVCEQAHQQRKEDLGLDHFEGRSWTGLHRHALMTMIAYAFLQQLAARAVTAAKHPGSPARPIRLGDGGGLYLQIAPGGGKSWLFRFMLAGKSREMGLGPVGEPPRGVTLAAARLAAAEARQLLRAGVDPIEQRAAVQRRAAADRERAAANTFQAAAEEMIDAREAGWRNAKHRWQWRATLATHAYPVLGTLPVAEIGTDDVLHRLHCVLREKCRVRSNQQVRGVGNRRRSVRQLT